MKSQPLTARQSEVLNFITDFIGKNGFSPTSREIADHFSVCQTRGAAYILALELKGYISHQPGKMRTIKILKP